MEWITWKQNGLEYLRKYKYILLILLVGIFMMALPEGEKDSGAVVVQAEESVPDLQQELAQILSRVAGAGKVEVLLTEVSGAETLYQTDDDSSSSDSARDLRRNTVLITKASHEEAGLVRQIIPPTYQGAIVLCQGAEDARVRLAMVNAVMSVTGLGSDKISVLKMK